jgi:hypothetical protein
MRESLQGYVTDGEVSCAPQTSVLPVQLGWFKEHPSSKKIDTLDERSSQRL